MNKKKVVKILVVLVIIILTLILTFFIPVRCEERRKVTIGGVTYYKDYYNLYNFKLWSEETKGWQ